VAAIKTKFSVTNCTNAPVNWTARVTYTGAFWGSGFNFPLTCAMSIAASSSQTCTVDERYLLIQQTYGVT
jgi:hypothetical protein